MPIIIGQEPGSDFRHPLGLLTDCHRRINHFLNVLHLVVRQGQRKSLDKEHREGLDGSLRYFREAAPKHTADEEESLFPRMLSRAGSDSAGVSHMLTLLDAEHRIISSDHGRVDELGRKWLLDGSLAADELIRLRTMLDSLQEIYARHIAIEEQDVFPLAARILQSSDLHSIAREMAQRRDLRIENYAGVES